MIIVLVLWNAKVGVSIRVDNLDVVTVPIVKVHVVVDVEVVVEAVVVVEILVLVAVLAALALGGVEFPVAALVLQAVRIKAVAPSVKLLTINIGPELIVLEHVLVLVMTLVILLSVKEHVVVHV